MLKSSNDFIQSILSSIITEIPIIGLYAKVLPNNFILNTTLMMKFKIIDFRLFLSECKEIKKIYNHLAISYDELKEKIKGIVILLMDTDEQLLEFETKDYPKLHCYRIVNVNKAGSKTTEFVQVSSNPKAPKTEIEDILNGKIFNDVLKDFKEEYPELLDFVVDQEKPELPSYFAMDLSPSQNDKLTQFFDNKPDNKVRFAQKYIEKQKYQKNSTKLGFIFERKTSAINAIHLIKGTIKHFV